jgi:hypothetical protein
MSRPVYVAVELRLLTEQADALAAFVGKFKDLIESDCMSCRKDQREDLLAALTQLDARLAERAEPFEVSR